MATYAVSSVLATAQTAALANSANLNSIGSQLTGNLQVATAEFETLVAYSASDTVNLKLLRLPAGARVIPELCSVNCSTTFTGDADLEVENGAIAGSADFSATSSFYTPAVVGDAIGYAALTTPQWVTLAISPGGTVSIGTKFTVNVTYAAAS